MQESVWYTMVESPLGSLLLSSDESGLCGLRFSAGRKAEVPATWRENTEQLGKVIEQLNAYFAGELRDFELSLAPKGTAFQKRVWQELLRIPYGETISYGELARRLGNPNAGRAVGLANGANPIAVVIPCHRVIGSNGKLTGYGGGLHNKEWLLAHEHREQRLL